MQPFDCILPVLFNKCNFLVAYFLEVFALRCAADRNQKEPASTEAGSLRKNSYGVGVMMKAWSC